VSCGDENEERESERRTSSVDLHADIARQVVNLTLLRFRKNLRHGVQTVAPVGRVKLESGGVIESNDRDADGGEGVDGKGVVGGVLNRA
jgi:hypothetical protein